MIKSEGVVLNQESFSNNKWNNVVIQVKYPLSLPNGTQQTTSLNSPAINDFLIDNSGFVWKITTCAVSGSNYVCTLEQQNASASSSMSPNNILEKGIIVTPNSKGLLAPYYHDSYNSTNVFRAAMSYNMNILSSSSNLLPGFYTDGQEYGYMTSSSNGGLKLENI